MSDETYDGDGIEIPGQQFFELDPDAEGIGAGRPSRRKRVIAGGAVLVTGLAVGGWGLSDALASSRATHGFPQVSGLAAASVVSADRAASAVDNAVVDIDATDGYGGGADAGTGMVITSNGDILTNNHVVADATSVTVTFVSSGRSYRAKVLGTDAADDVALLKVSGVSGLATINAGNSDSVTAGMAVAAVGNALGRSGTPTVTTGTITGAGRSITASDGDGTSSERLTGMLETDADVVSGDSGGPLVDSSGQVIGMDTAAAANDSGGQGFEPSAITSSNDGYAIPITKALSIARTIAAGQASSSIVIGTPGFLGLELGSTAGGTSPGGGYGGGYGNGYPPGFGDGGNGFGWPGGSSSGQGFGTAYSTATATAATSSSGLTVVGVVQNSPAANAGIVAGDTITSLNGTSVTTERALTAILDRTHGGDRVTVGWNDSAGTSHHATVTLIDGPAA